VAQSGWPDPSCQTRPRPPNASRPPEANHDQPVKPGGQGAPAPAEGPVGATDWEFPTDVGVLPSSRCLRSMIRRAPSTLWIPCFAQGFAHSRSAAASPALWEGLEAVWDFGLGIGGPMALDGSGRNRHGAWYGTGPRWSAERWGWTGEFNGTDDYVLLPSFHMDLWETPTALWPPPVTVAVSFRPLSAAEGAIFAQSYTVSSVPMLELGWNNGACYCFRRDQAGNVFEAHEAPGTHAVGACMQVATVSRAANRHELWVNGRLVASSTVALQAMPSNRMTIGARWSSGGLLNHVNARLAVVAAWSRALTPQEIGLLCTDFHAVNRPRCRSVALARRSAFGAAGQVVVPGAITGQVDVPGTMAGQIAV